MKKVLLLAYYFPPVMASGAMRPLAFCRFLGDHGWLPHVITTDLASCFPPHPSDLGLLAKVPASVRVDALPHGNPMQWLLTLRKAIWNIFRLEECAGADDQNPSPGDMTIATNGERPSLKTLMLTWAFEFPDPQNRWLKKVVHFGRHLPQSQVPDVVLATGGPWTSLLVGQQLSQLWGVPLIVDYRDPWSSNPYASFSSAWLNKKAKQLEKSVCRSASLVITNTRELRIHLQNDNPEIAHKIVTITNGFDPDSFSSLVGQRRGREKSEDRGHQILELCHFGTLYGKRTPVEFLKGVFDLYQSGSLHNSKFRLRFVGAWDIMDSRCEELSLRLEKVGILKRGPPVPYAECVQQMTEADLLLVLQPDSPLQIPAKIYEYIAARRPLVLVGGEGATANLVQQHSLGVVCRNNAAAVRNCLTDIIAARHSMTAPTSETVNRFNYRSLTAELADHMDNACATASVSMLPRA